MGVLGPLWVVHRTKRDQAGCFITLLLTPVVMVSAALLTYFAAWLRDGSAGLGVVGVAIVIGFLVGIALWIFRVVHLRGRGR